jgi:hypothetical protein
MWPPFITTSTPETAAAPAPTVAAPAEAQSPPPTAEAAPTTPTLAAGTIVEYQWADPLGDHSRYGRVIDVLAGDPEDTAVVEWLELSGPIALSQLAAVQTG